MKKYLSKKSTATAKTYPFLLQRKNLSLQDPFHHKNSDKWLSVAMHRKGIVRQYLLVSDRNRLLLCAAYLL
jgi:hypothetical protein